MAACNAINNHFQQTIDLYSHQNENKLRHEDHISRIKFIFTCVCDKNNSRLIHINFVRTVVRVAALLLLCLILHLYIIAILHNLLPIISWFFQTFRLSQRICITYSYIVDLKS